MFRRFINELLHDMLPRKTKRQIFLVSFAALLKGATSYDRETFQKLNRVLTLSESTDTALAVPVMLSRVIWMGKDACEICNANICEGNFTADRVKEVATSLLNSMPAWLTYGRNEDMEKDIAVILHDRFGLLGA